MRPSSALRRPLPEYQGISSKAILSFLDRIETTVKEMHSFMLLRHGAVVAEGWWRPYGPEIPHMLFSLSQSFTSTAVGNEAADLKRRLEALRLDPPQGPANSPRASAVSGVEYAVEPNEQKISSFLFAFAPDSCSMTIRRERHRSALAAGYGEWRDSTLALPDVVTGVTSKRPVLASGVWMAEDTFVVTIRQVQSPFVYTMRIRFVDDELFCDMEVNVAFGPTTMPPMRARKRAGGKSDRPGAREN